MLKNISERLENDATGKRKTFRSSTASALFEELEYMEEQLRSNGIGGGGALSEVRGRIKNLLGGQTAETFPDSLRRSSAYREQVRRQTLDIADKILSTSVSAPRRNILLTKKRRRVSE